MNQCITVFFKIFVLLPYHSIDDYQFNVSFVKQLECMIKLRMFPYKLTRLSLVSIKPISTTTTTNFEPEQSD